MDDEELKRRIEARARELWEADGRPEGRDMGTSAMDNTTDSPPGKLGATSPIVLAVAVALVVLAAIGWWRAIDRSSAVAALETVKVGLDKEVAELKGQLADTGQKLADTGQKLVETEKANGDLATVESKLAEATGTPASEAELAQIQSRIGERLKILGEREQALAAHENKVRLAAYRVDQLQGEGATVESRLAAMKGQLEQIDSKRLQTAEQSLAVVRGELARTQAETADRARTWSEDREHLEADLARLRLAIERRSAELTQVQADRERSAAAAKIGESARNALTQQLTALQRESDTLRQAADEAREQLRATAAMLSMRERELMKRNEALAMADGRTGEPKAAMRSAQEVEEDRRQKLPARPETVEETSDDVAQRAATQLSAATNLVPPTRLSRVVAQSPPTDLRALEDLSQETPSVAGHGTPTLGELPAMLEARDLYAAPSGHGEIGPERAVGRVVNVESHADSGLDVLRAALASTKHRTEGRPGAEPQ